jgi:hypothetical protein
MNPPEGRCGTPPATGSPDRLDKATLKVHLPNGGFNVVKFGDAIDVKVRSHRQHLAKFHLVLLGFIWNWCNTEVLTFFYISFGTVRLPHAFSHIPFRFHMLSNDTSMPTFNAISHE